MLDPAVIAGKTDWNRTREVAMAREWHRGSIELADGYKIMDGDGKMAHQLDSARFSIEGGFLYVDVQGTDDFQVLPSVAVARLTYQRMGHRE